MEEDTDPAEEEVEEGIDPVAAEKEVEDIDPAVEEEGIVPVAAEQADTHPVVG